MAARLQGCEDRLQQIELMLAGNHTITSRSLAEIWEKVKINLEKLDTKLGKIQENACTHVSTVESKLISLIYKNQDTVQALSDQLNLFSTQLKILAQSMKFNSADSISSNLTQICQQLLNKEEAREKRQARLETRLETWIQQQEALSGKTDRLEQKMISQSTNEENSSHLNKMKIEISKMQSQLEQLEQGMKKTEHQITEIKLQASQNDKIDRGGRKFGLIERDIDPISYSASNLRTKGQEEKLEGMKQFGNYKYRSARKQINDLNEEGKNIFEIERHDSKQGINRLRSKEREEKEENIISRSGGKQRAQSLEGPAIRSSFDRKNPLLRTNIPFNDFQEKAEVGGPRGIIPNLNKLEDQIPPRAGLRGLLQRSKERGPLPPPKAPLKPIKSTPHSVSSHGINPPHPSNRKDPNSQYMGPFFNTTLNPYQHPSHEPYNIEIDSDQDQDSEDGCAIDQQGYLIDQYGNYLLDEKGQKMRLTEQEIRKLEIQQMYH